MVAKQALNDVSTVIVKSQNAMVLAATPQIGDYGYNLTLPIGAPSLGQYGTPLPITLTPAAQSLIAGVYTIESSAQTATTSYTTQASSPVNITGGSAVQNFTLVP